MKLFEIIYYSVDEGVLTPETSWTVEATSIESVMNRCTELNKLVSSGAFSARVITTYKLSNLTNDFMINQLKNL